MVARHFIRKAAAYELVAGAGRGDHGEGVDGCHDASVPRIKRHFTGCEPRRVKM